MNSFMTLVFQEKLALRVGSYEEEKGTMYTFEQLISKLTKREQDIIRKRYVDNRTQCDIAVSMGCTRENVRSIESKA